MPTGNSGLQAQTQIFTIENRYFFVQMASQASWPPDLSADSLEVRSPQPGIFFQESSGRNPQLGVLSQREVLESSARDFYQESSARFFGSVIHRQCKCKIELFGAARWSLCTGHLQSPSSCTKDLIDLVKEIPSAEACGRIVFLLYFC